jgi:hypothetical protein
MTPAAFISRLEARGVRLEVDHAAPSGVVAVAPRGIITPDLARKITEALPRLRPLLAQEGEGEKDAHGSLKTRQSFGETSGHDRDATEEKVGEKWRKSGVLDLVALGRVVDDRIDLLQKLQDAGNVPLAEVQDAPALGELLAEGVVTLWSISPGACWVRWPRSPSASRIPAPAPGPYVAARARWTPEGDIFGAFDSVT